MASSYRTRRERRVVRAHPRRCSVCGPFLRRCRGPLRRNNHLGFVIGADDAFDLVKLAHELVRIRQSKILYASE